MDMTETISAPLYLLRGLQLIGWRNMQHALDYLYADGTIRQGTLVAINAEKMLAVEDDPEVRALIEAAEFKYADGIMQHALDYLYADGTIRQGT
ncbi:hypothetical protein UA70_06830, partial [Raoultella planticola]